MKRPSLFAQIVAVLSRRTPAFQPAPGQPRTFGGALYQMLHPRPPSAVPERASTDDTPPETGTNTSFGQARAIGRDRHGQPFGRDVLGPEADLSGADLTRANLTGANLEDARFALTEPEPSPDAVVTALAGARWSEETIWPTEEIAATVARSSRLLKDGYHEIVDDGQSRGHDYQPSTPGL
jgi:hypothetical protein